MMVVFRSHRVRVRRPGLSDREVADALAPRHTGTVEVAPVEPPVERPEWVHADGSIDPDERSQWVSNLP